MKTYRYSRWDGTQDEFSVDPEQALDALSDLMMEGMDARQALEQMRRLGFELGGLDMRVMGLDELVDQLRDAMRELQQQWDLSESMDEWRERLDDILTREQQAVHRAHGHESARMNDFLGRRHADVQGVAGAISAFDGYAFEDPEAAEEFEALRQELERMGSLEDFLQEQGSRFQGPQMADYEITRAETLRLNL